MVPAEPILVEFSAVPEYVAVARRIAEVVGARAGLSVLQLEEVQIAVSEVCNRLVTAAQEDDEDPPSMRLRFWSEPEAVVIECTGLGSQLQRALAGLLDEGFALFLMGRLVDRVARAQTPDGVVLRMEKARATCLDNASAVSV